MPADPPVARGELIGGRYRLGDRLGEGGMGVVFAASDEQLHRSVAIKFVSPQFLKDGDRLARFKNEARALSALNHPHIITIYEIGEAAGAPFIATELVEGQTLRERLRGAPIAYREAIDIGLQVARALAAAHGKGIVHRDIKPENVMIRRDGYVKVLDFGLAGLRAAAETGASVMTAGDFETIASATVGTPAYISPEQAAGRPIDPRSDIFSLGILLCEAVGGVNPFSRPSVIETLRAIDDTPEAAAAATAKLPAGIGVVVRKALQKQPEDRYASAADVAAELQRILSGLDAPGAPARVSRRQIGIVAVALALVAAIAIAGGFAYRRSSRRLWVREQALPDIARLTAADRSAAAFPLIAQAETYLPGDADVSHAVAAATRAVSVESSPPGATVSVQDYLAPDEAWLPVGVTPLIRARVPSGYLRWKISKPGVGELIAAPETADSMRFDLAAAAAAPDGMAPVAGGAWGDLLAFLGVLGPYDLPPFFVDRLEVTNRDYQQFIDKGGYANRDFWKEPFVRDGRTLTWPEAMDLFRDSTGRPGPSTWEAGHFPDGKADFPVSGVSWFEAAAYAQFAGKSLPVLAQSAKVEPYTLDRYLTRMSNLSPTLARAGESKALGVFGTYDTVGNVREWSWNASGDALRYILGRQATSYGPEALSPFDRSALNGFRCVRNAGPVPAAALASRPLLHRDFAGVKPASDDVFRIYRSLYAYDKRPLHAAVTPVSDSSEDWTRERATFDTAYGGRMDAVLLLPRNVKPPYQTLVFFPSARVNGLQDSTALGDLSFVDFVIRSGRAIVYPIYQGMYERHSTMSIAPGGTLAREVMIDWSKDLGRTLDYLNTRQDIDSSRIGYLGVSQGSAEGVVFAALEDRLKTAVFLDGGYFQHEHPLAGTDQVDFAPRLTKPVLMINGRYDATFPVGSSQEPMFRMLGTPESDKRRVVFDTPHDVRQNRPALVAEVIGWLDKYFGRIK